MEDEHTSMKDETQHLLEQVKKLEQAVEREKQLKTEVSLHKPNYSGMSLILPFG